MLNDCFGNKPVIFSNGEKQFEFWGGHPVNFDAALLRQQMMVFRRKVEIVVP